MNLGSACCCRAMILGSFPRIEDAQAFFRRDLSLALRQAPSAEISRQNLQFFSLLEPLPVSWDEWPDDSKAACPRVVYEKSPAGPSHQRWRCKLVTPDGACSAYARRPYICSNYKPNGIECAYCSNYQDSDGSCRPSSPVEVSPCSEPSEPSVISPSA